MFEFCDSVRLGQRRKVFRDLRAIGKHSGQQAGFRKATSGASGIPRSPTGLQIVIALVVTPEGLPLVYEVLPGNTVDRMTLRGFLERIERQYGTARRAG